jgi:alkanesulfonate monooxygenase SsuD/methylene tetrahydromethanopterin reductase-like flavin-dependent oxidoreductase (luciferase family)
MRTFAQRITSPFGASSHCDGFLTPSASFSRSIYGGRPARFPGAATQIADALQQVIDETGARRLLVETFSRDEARLFAREVIQAPKKRTATAA